jgi:hypothetical protein
MQHYRLFELWICSLTLMLSWQACVATLTDAQDRVAVEPARPVRARVAEGPRPAARSPRYAVELQPHVIAQWAALPRRSEVGLGLGFRASIPVLGLPPLRGLRHNLAVSFGMDWAYLGVCESRAPACRGDDFWFPVVMQWNLFLTRWWSVFPELGLAIHHAAWGVRYIDEPGPAPRAGVCGPGRAPDCWVEGRLTELTPAAWLGTRFSLSDAFSFTLRMGFPAFVAGVSLRL